MRVLRVNRALAERAGFPDPADVVGKTDFHLFSEEHARQAFEDEQEISKRLVEPVQDVPQLRRGKSIQVLGHVVCRMGRQRGADAPRQHDPAGDQHHGGRGPQPRGL